MKKVISVFLCIMMFCGFFSLPVFSFNVTHYEEDVFAGGILDYYAFVDGDTDSYTFQWQVDLGLGSGSWSNLEDNEAYSGTKTNHMQLRTKAHGTYIDWDVIPFSCVVTDKYGNKSYTQNIYCDIFSTDSLYNRLEEWGYCLYEPTLTNVNNLSTSDYKTYTANAYAGSNIAIFCGSKSIDNYSVLRNSEVELSPEIHITENGKTTSVGNTTSYIPYTIGNLKIEIKLPLKIGGVFLKDFDTKTINVTVTKPTPIAIGKTKSACSLLRYTYNESQKLASVPKGASVEILGQEGGYYKVFYQNYVGYIGTSLLNVDNSSSGDSVINNVDIEIAEPMGNENPSFNCYIYTNGCELYKTEPITWYDKTANKYVYSSDKFTEGHDYALTVWIQAKNGYRFKINSSDNPDLTGSINGDKPPYIHKAYEQDPEKVIEFVYDFYNVKNAPVHECSGTYVNRVEPTCTQNGHEAYYHCQCGKNYKEITMENEVDINSWGIISATGHKESAWRTTQVYHYKVCTSCGEFLKDEDHKGGTAYCERQAICTVCNTPYGEFGSHSYSSVWTSMGKSGHAHNCVKSNCSDHDTIVPHNPGPEATEKEPQKCKDCGYIIAPAKNHTHKLTKVAKKSATCTKEGNIEYYTCSGCSEKFTDAGGKNKISGSVSVSPLGHKVSEKTYYDENFHWSKCTVCSEVLIETKMAHEIKNNKCTTCDFKLEEKTESSSPESSENSANSDKPESSEKETSSVNSAQKPNESENSKGDSSEKEPSASSNGGLQNEKGEEKTNDVFIAILLGLVSFAAAITATVIIMKKKK